MKIKKKECKKKKNLFNHLQQKMKGVLPLLKKNFLIIFFYILFS